MGGLVYLFQFLECGVRVNLRRRHAFVTEQFLHAFQSRPVIEHRRGEGVPQHVWRTVLLGAHATKLFSHPVPHRRTVETEALAVYEKCAVVSYHATVSLFDIAFQLRFQFLAERYKALFVAFSRHLQLTVHEIHGLVVERDEFLRCIPVS